MLSRRNRSLSGLDLSGKSVNRSSKTWDICLSFNKEGSRFRTAGNQNMRSFVLILGEPSTNRELNPKDLLPSAGSPQCWVPPIRSVRATWGLFFPRDRSPSPDPYRVGGTICITFERQSMSTWDALCLHTLFVLTSSTRLAVCNISLCRRCLFHTQRENP